MISWCKLPRCGLYAKPLKLFSSRNFSRTSVNRKKIPKYPRLSPDQVLKHPAHELTIDDELYNSLKGKVIYNCLVTRRNSKVRWYIRKELIKKENDTIARPSVPLSLKYMCGDSVYEIEEFRNATQGSTREVQDRDIVEDDSDVNLPYSSVKAVEHHLVGVLQPDCMKEKEMNIDDLRARKFERETDVDPPEIIGKKWMSDYEVFEEGVSDESEVIDFPRENYGTADPHVSPTTIPCGGCGAHLHCQSSSIPGFLPKEIFLKCTRKDFYRIICQRCTFLKHYNVALSVSVDPDAYPKLLSSLKAKECCLVIMVDMSDFPCSIWPNILDIVGRDKPILLVGNKIDLIPGDYRGWLDHAKTVLRKNFPKEANVISTCLISAKTGFGVEDLITSLQSKWKRNGDVYLVGCTNVGKSSLFNALIASDYCKAKACDLMQRATVNPWPGTTLNLLKFPIMRMEAWRIYLRNQRLRQERKFLMNEKELEKQRDEENGVKTSSIPTITGQIGRTFRYKKPQKKEEVTEEFVFPRLTNQFIKSDERPFLDPDDKDFVNSKWCYDTPGVVHHDQLINLLTTEELNIVTTNSLYRARIFSVYVGQTLFVGGLARIDHVESEGQFMRFLVYSPGTLPITICWTEAAEEVYNSLLGTKFLQVPCGSPKRMEKWPMLTSGKDIEIVGQGSAQNTSEIVLSSAGWVSFTGKLGVKSTMRPWTPEGRGIYLRSVPLLRYTPRQRRCRVSGTPTYYMKYL